MIKTVKVFRIISKILSISSLSVMILLVFLLAGIRLFGLTPYTVLSGSMEPNYHVGSVVYVSKVAPAELKVGDTITYRISEGVIVTHRIVEIITEDGGTPSFRTKGDANKVADGIHPSSAVIGKVVFSIPYLGYVASFVQTTTGLLVTLGSCIMLLAISFVIDALFPKQKKQSESEA